MQKGKAGCSPMFIPPINKSEGMTYLGLDCIKKSNELLEKYETQYIDTKSRWQSVNLVVY